MRKQIYITLLLLAFSVALSGQNWPRFYWNQIQLADTIGAIAIAQPDSNGIWSDSLRWWQGQLLAGSDTMATRAYARSASVWQKTGANIYYSAGSVGVKEASPSYDLDMGGQGGFRLSGGNELQRPAGVERLFYYNTDEEFPQWHDGIQWRAIPPFYLSSSDYQLDTDLDINASLFVSGNINANGNLEASRLTAERSARPSITLAKNSSTQWIFENRPAGDWNSPNLDIQDMALRFNIGNNNAGMSLGYDWNDANENDFRGSPKLSLSSYAYNSNGLYGEGFAFETSRSDTVSNNSTFSIVHYLNLDGGVTVRSDSLWLLKPNGDFGFGGIPQAKFHVVDGAETILRNYKFNMDQDTTGLDGQILTFNGPTGQIELKPNQGEPDTNISTEDITFTQPRSHDIADNTLTFDGIGGDDLLVIDGDGATVAIGGTTNSNVALKIGGTEGVLVPSGTVGERPSTASDGIIRNSITAQTIEGYMDGEYRSMQQSDEIVTTATGVTVVVYKNTFIAADMATSSQTLTLDPTDLATGAKVTVLVTNSNDCTLDSDTGNFISTSANNATVPLTAGAYLCTWTGSNWYIITLQ